MDKISIFDERINILHRLLHNKSDFSQEVAQEYSFRGNFKSGLITISKKLWKGCGHIISEQDIFCGDLDAAITFAEALPV